MSHFQQKRFCLSAKKQYPVFFQEKLVLDVGSLDINGSNRFLFQSCNYVGIDLMPGENVDFVSKAHELKLPDSSFDTIISTECFEHDKFYRESIRNIIRMLKPGGMFIFTCATTGRPEHGTKRTTPDDSPFLKNFGDWEDYYKNLTEADIRNIVDINSIFKKYQFSTNEESHDLYFVGIKSGKLINQNNTFSESKVIVSNSKLTTQIVKLESKIEKRDEQVLSYQDEINEVSTWGKSLQQQLDQQTEQVNTLSQAVEKRDEQVLSYQDILENLNKEYNYIQGLLRVEKLTILKPIYRVIYKNIGLILRKALPVKMVEYIKINFLYSNDVVKKIDNFPISNKNLHNSSESFSTPSFNAESDVFVFSIINWNFRHQRPQHISEGLSKLGRRVFYIEMDLTNGEHQISKISKNLYVVRISKKDIGHIQPYTGIPSKDQLTAWIKGVYQICNIINSTNLKDVIIQHPFWWQLTQHLPPEFRITFDCMDDISGFSNTENFLLDLELDLLKNCDNLVVSSQFLFDKYKKFNVPNLVRNGADVSNFDIHKEHADFPNLHHFPKTNSKSIKVGYVGAIAEWFDVNLVRKVALQNIDFEFHLCGDVTTEEAQQLQGIDNVHLYGEIPYLNVAGFFQEMDVLTIPFKLVPIIQACDPVKFYEYSAMEKPTVTTNLPELKRASEITFVAKDADDFGKQIRHASAKSKEIVFRKKLSVYAKNNSWNDRSKSFNNTLKDLAKVSVVILSYGDPELTKATLYSLFDKGSNYPNLEVIIVDNASPQEDIEDITNFAEKYPNTIIIKNAENLGFAKGNNVGISASTGKYVLLLNNDTVVAPGAILSMVNHLINNPKIGVVGPLTNNIGNEAKLFVEYENMDQMKNVARSATTGYRGKHLSINVVAYFAVMFRKSDLDKFGLLSEDYGRGMFEDDDHCQVIKSHGYICALAEDAFVHHHLSASFSKMNDHERNELFNKNKETFEKKWGKWKSHEYRKNRPATSF